MTYVKYCPKIKQRTRNIRIEAKSKNKMKRNDLFKFYKTGISLEGALTTLAPVPLYTAFIGTNGDAVYWRICFAIAAVCCVFFAAAAILRHPILTRIFGSGAVCLTIVSAAPAIPGRPSLALFLSVVFIYVHFQIFDFSEFHRLPKKIFFALPVKESLKRVRASFLAVPFMALFRTFFQVTLYEDIPVVLILSLFISAFFLFDFAWKSKSRIYFGFACGWFLAIVLLLSFHFYNTIPGFALIYGILIRILLPKTTRPSGQNNVLQEVFFDRPARILFWSFFLLCSTGTLMLLAPSASSGQTIRSIDAAFTAVSAVCVTGLVVLDTSKDFSPIGQLYIMILIQLGGLGIMTIATAIFQIVGRRLSLRQETMMTSITETDHHVLFSSLTLIIKFTFVVEAIGAFLLTFAYFFSGQTLGAALWQGIFTAVSAFCNAGFMLTSTNLVGYQNNPVILYTVAFLIILGGLAPVTSLMIPAWLKGKPVQHENRLVLGTTALLLFGGTALILVFEWNGVLDGLPFLSKIHNAWFQSATLRTAGFNSVTLEQIKDPTLFTMVALMFIGGSPGGTAGGIKTTTAAILFLTFWATVLHKNKVVYHYRRISNATIRRAVTTFLAGLFIWGFFIFSLMLTQSIPAREIIFEITSALGTVGLTIGATPQLDELGKFIVMAAMFFGRIGPVTLFMYMSTQKNTEFNDYPDLKMTMS